MHAVRLLCAHCSGMPPALHVVATAERVFLRLGRDSNQGSLSLFGPCRPPSLVCTAAVALGWLYISMIVFYYWKAFRYGDVRPAFCSDSSFSGMFVGGWGEVESRGGPHGMGRGQEADGGCKSSYWGLESGWGVRSGGYRTVSALRDGLLLLGQNGSVTRGGGGGLPHAWAG